MEKQYLLAIILLIVLIALVGGASGKLQELLINPFQNDLTLQGDCLSWATQNCASNKVTQNMMDSVKSVPNCGINCGLNGKFPCMCGTSKLEDKDNKKYCCYTSSAGYEKKDQCIASSCKDSSLDPSSLDRETSIDAYKYNCWMSTSDGSPLRNLLQANCGYQP